MRSGYQPLDGRVKAVVIVFTLIIATAVAAMICDVLELSLVNRIVDGEEIADADYDANDTRQAIVGGLQTLGFIVGAVVFIRWLHRAYQNVDAVAPTERRYGHGWAIGGWFVPLLNFVRPMQVVNDVWRAGGWPRSAVIPGLWWAVFIASGIYARFATSAYGAEEPEEFRDGVIMMLVSDAIDIPSALLAIALVISATRRLDRRAAETPEPEPDPQPAWPPPERPEVPAGEPFPSYPG